MNSEKIKEYWALVAQEIEKKNKEGHPSHWKREVIFRFLEEFLNKVRQLCELDDEKSRACGLFQIKGKFNYDELDLSYDTFRRIFVTKQSLGRHTTRNLFAVYLGANSYAQYLLEKKLDAENTIDVRKSEEYFESLISTKNKGYKFYVYDNVWVGRKDKVELLTERLKDGYKLIVIVGITGIGKTALAEKIIQETLGIITKHNSINFYRIDLDGFHDRTSFSEVSTQVLMNFGVVLSPQQSSPSDIFWNFFNLFKTKSFIVIIDSLEHILIGNEKEGWMDFKEDWWEKLFRESMIDPNFQSIFIITTQDFPRQLFTLGAKYSNRFYYTSLSGLQTNEQQELFQKLGLGTDKYIPSHSYLERIGRAFEGHPLALRIICGEILNAPYHGNVLAYWDTYSEEIETLEKAILNNQEDIKSSEHQKVVYLDLLNRELRNTLHLRLEQTFKRLREANYLAYELLCSTAHYYHAVPMQFWVNHLKHRGKSPNEIRNAFAAIKDRYLVEEVIENGKIHLRQHNLVRSVSLRHALELS